MDALTTSAASAETHGHGGGVGWQLLRLQCGVASAFSLTRPELAGGVHAVLCDVLLRLGAVTAAPEDWIYLEHAYSAAIQVLQQWCAGGPGGAAAALATDMPSEPASSAAMTALAETLDDPPSVASHHIRTITEYTVGCLLGAEADATGGGDVIDRRLREVTVAVSMDLFTSDGMDSAIAGTAHLALAALCCVKALGCERLRLSGAASASALPERVGARGTSADVPPRRSVPDVVVRSLEMHRLMLKNVANVAWSFRADAMPGSSSRSTAIDDDDDASLLLDYKDATAGLGLGVGSASDSNSSSGETTTASFLTTAAQALPGDQYEAVLENFRMAVVACSNLNSIVPYAGLVAKFDNFLQRLRRDDERNVEDPATEAAAAAAAAAAVARSTMDVKTIQLFLTLRVTDLETEARFALDAPGASATDVARIATDLVSSGTSFVGLLDAFLPTNSAALHEVVSDLVYDSLPLLCQEDNDADGRGPSSTAPAALSDGERARRKLLLASAIHTRQTLVTNALLRTQQVVRDDGTALLRSYLRMRSFLECVQLLLSSPWSSLPVVYGFLKKHHHQHDDDDDAGKLWHRTQKLLVADLVAYWRWALRQRRGRQEGDDDAAKSKGSVRGLGVVARALALSKSSSVLSGHTATTVWSEMVLVVRSATRDVASLVEGVQLNNFQENVAQMTAQLHVVLADTVVWDASPTGVQLCRTAGDGQPTGGITAVSVQELRALAGRRRSEDTTASSSSSSSLVGEDTSPLAAAVFSVLEQRGLSTPAEHLQFLRCEVNAIVDRFWGYSVDGGAQAGPRNVSVVQWVTGEPVDHGDGGGGGEGWPRVVFDMDRFGILASRAHCVEQCHELRNILLLWKKAADGEDNADNGNNNVARTLRQGWRTLLTQLATVPDLVGQVSGARLGIACLEYVYVIAIYRS